MKLGISTQLNGPAVRERKRLSMVHNVQGLPDTTEPLRELLGCREEAVSPTHSTSRLACST